jgi:hypothetical protein
MWNLSKEAKFVRLNNAAAAAQTTVTSAAFDMKGQATAGKYTNWPAGGTVATSTVPDGFDALCVIVALNTVVATGVITVTLQDCTTSGGSYTSCTAALADFASTNTSNATVTQNSTLCGIVVTDIGGNTSNSLIILDVVLPQLEFVQVVVNRATANITLDGIFGIAYRSKARPVVHDSTVSATGFFVSST